MINLPILLALSAKCRKKISTLTMLCSCLLIQEYKNHKIQKIFWKQQGLDKSVSINIMLRNLEKQGTHNYLHFLIVQVMSAVQFLYYDTLWANALLADGHHE